MVETFTIHIAENGYVIRSGSDMQGVATDIRIASDGNLEEELKAFRVAQKLNDTMKFVPSPVPHPTHHAAKAAAYARSQAQADHVSKMLGELLGDVDITTLDAGTKNAVLKCAHESVSNDLRDAIPPRMKW